MRPAAVEKYLAARAVTGPWRLEGDEGTGVQGTVVVPALAENESIGATLQSLATNPPEVLERFLILVVINHRPDADPAEKADNQALLSRLRQGQGIPEALRLAWIDGCSPGRELPLKDGGVGLARRIGFDLALPRLDWSGSALLVSLDADTQVDPGYLQAIQNHFVRTEQGAAVLAYRHQPGATQAQDRAMDLYELYLRHYVLGLSLAGSPYAYHSIGSALACRAEAYVRAGGMNRRRAGEDFYFLQQLAKTCGVSRVTGTRVYPSARISRRTPFGTGRTLERQAAGEPDAVRFYPAETFRILSLWLELVSSNWEAQAKRLLEQSALIDLQLHAFLQTERFSEIWGRLRNQHRSAEALARAFHGWFDALKTFRLIHHLCRGGYPEPREAVFPLLEWAGLTRAQDIGEQLAILRTAQDGEMPFQDVTH